MIPIHPAVTKRESLALWAGESNRVARTNADLRGPPTRTEALSLEAKRALGGLISILDLPDLRDILVHVTEGEGSLWIDRSGRLERVPGWSASPAAVRALAISLISAGGRHIDELRPFADVRIGDGIRVHAVLSPISTSGTCVSVRVPRLTPLTFSQLADAGLCAPPLAAGLRRAVRARKNLLITGGTGTGKTTVLAGLLDLADPADRIVLIEDVAELRLRHAHTVSLEARQANTEGAGDIGLEQLLRESLRMRPDRIVLGECRGPEIATLMSALNTGHDGGAGTLHASRLIDVPSRIEALGMLAGLTPRALARQAVSALHLIVHLVREPEGHRIAAVGRLTVTGAGTLGIERVR